MKIITAISRKGGVGKSTCLKGMAMITASKGLNTVLIDTDGNEPMMKFQTTGKELGYWTDNIKAISIFEDSNSDIANILDDLEDDGVDYVFIDTKGGEGDFVALVMQAADFIIVPTGLSKDDVDGAENTIIWMQELQEAGLDIAPYEVLISNLPSASSLSVTNKEILADIQENFPLLDATIPPNKTTGLCSSHPRLLDIAFTPCQLKQSHTTSSRHGHQLHSPVKQFKIIRFTAYFIK